MEMENSYHSICSAYFVVYSTTVKKSSRDDPFMHQIWSFSQEYQLWLHQTAAFCECYANTVIFLTMKTVFRVARLAYLTNWAYSFVPSVHCFEPLNRTVANVTKLCVKINAISLYIAEWSQKPVAVLLQPYRKIKTEI